MKPSFEAQSFRSEDTYFRSFPPKAAGRLLPSERARFVTASYAVPSTVWSAKKRKHPKKQDRRVVPESASRSHTGELSSVKEVDPGEKRVVMPQHRGRPQQT